MLHLLCVLKAVYHPSSCGHRVAGDKGDPAERDGGAGAGVGVAGKVGNAKGEGKKPKVADMKKKSLRRL